MLRIAIVGLGPWGLCALERVVTIADQELPPHEHVVVHVIEPGTPGSGVYDTAQPDYLLLNNACGQLSLYPFETETYQPCYGVGLYEWAVERGYRWVDDRCVIDPAGQAIEPHHFLPRRLMGEYLQWFYRALLVGAPRNVHILHHSTSAVDVAARRDGSEEVRLADGTGVLADHVILTTGHTANDDADGSGDVYPYPVTPYVEEIPADAKVAVSGMGLVAVDVVTALTIGRGGRFVEDGNALRYRPSGREPELRLYCRSGLPFTAKSVTEVDRSVVYKPLICTPEALDGLTGRLNGHRRHANVRTELLPLMFAEMDARYYAQLAYQASGSASDGAAVRERLRAAWVEQRFEAERERLASRFGSFDPHALFFGRERSFASGEDYERSVYEALADDLHHAEIPDGASPVKSATEVFRIFRDRMRSVVELGGLTLESYVDFNKSLSSRIHRLVAGPPALRSRQMLALMDSGIVRAPYGPAPIRTVAADAATPSRIRSTLLARPYADDVDLVIRGHLEHPRLAGSGSLLLSRLHDRGRLTQLRYGEVEVGSVHLTPDSHPIDGDGRPQTSLSVFGVLTEGVRHFTAYIPSPRSRMRAVEDIGACVTELLGGGSLGERLAA